MALPKLSTPTYRLIVPSTQEEIKYRPFLVQEEKTLLMAMESSETSDMIDALKQILTNCIISDIDVNKLATFDIEYIFSQLRSKSIGNTIDLKAKMSCETEGCPKVIPFSVNLDELEFIQDENHTKKLELTEKDGIVMKYPSFEMVNRDTKKKNTEAFYDLIIDCIDYIYDADKVYNAKDHTREELKDYLNVLTHPQFEKISNFFETMPKIQKTSKIVCPKCGKTEDLVVAGLENFFG